MTTTVTTCKPPRTHTARIVSDHGGVASPHVIRRYKRWTAGASTTHLLAAIVVMLAMVVIALAVVCGLAAWGNHTQGITINNQQQQITELQRQVDYLKAETGH